MMGYLLKHYSRNKMSGIEKVLNCSIKIEIIIISVKHYNFKLTEINKLTKQ